MADCPHGLDDRWCATCKSGPEPRSTVPRVVAHFRAQWPGDCGGCNLPIYIGQDIVKLSNSQYVHEGCEP